MSGGVGQDFLDALNQPSSGSENVGEDFLSAIGQGEPSESSQPVSTESETSGLETAADIAFPLVGGVVGGALTGGPGS